MGDRANVYVHEGERPGVYFYTHWDGTELPDIVAAALVRGRNRWGDHPYLARIIFSEMIKGAVLAETGYGIDTQVGDGDDRVIDVDTLNNTVTVEGYTGVPAHFMGFDDYVKSRMGDTRQCQCDCSSGTKCGCTNCDCRHHAGWGA